MTKNADLLTNFAPFSAPELKDDKVHKSVEFPELSSDLARNRLLDTTKSAALLNYSVAHFRRLYRTGLIPPPIRVGGRKCGWVASDLLEFIERRAREAARTPPPCAP